MWSSGLDGGALDLQVPREPQVIVSPLSKFLDPNQGFMYQFCCFLVWNQGDIYLYYPGSPDYLIPLWYIHPSCMLSVGLLISPGYPFSMG